MKQIIPINTDKDGCCRCLKADYYKMACTNFLRKIWGGGSPMVSLPQVF